MWYHPRAPVLSAQLVALFIPEVLVLRECVGWCYGVSGGFEHSGYCRGHCVVGRYSRPHVYEPGVGPSCGRCWFYSRPGVCDDWKVLSYDLVVSRSQRWAALYDAVSAREYVARCGNHGCHCWSRVGRGDVSVVLCARGGCSECTVVSAVVLVLAGVSMFSGCVTVIGGASRV